MTKFPTLDEAFLEVTEAIADAAEELGAITDAQTQKRTDFATTSGAIPTAQSNRRQDIRSSNLGITKQFTDHEKDQFLDKAFEYIATYFENSLGELKARNPEIDSRFKRIDSNQFSATVYKDGVRVNGCRIWTGGDRFLSNGIAFSFNESRNDGSINESLTVKDDGHSLFLEPMGFQLMGRAVDKQLTNQGGAEYYWSLFIEPLQR